MNIVTELSSLCADKPVMNLILISIEWFVVVELFFIDFQLLL